MGRSAPGAGTTVEVRLPAANRLSHYLRFVRRGEPVTVYHRDRPNRLGYLISSPEGGSGWQQAYRERGGGGDEIWIRLVDDGRHAPWLDLRSSTWNQFPQGQQPNGDTRPFLFRSGQVQEDVQTVRDACEGSRNGVVARRP